MWSDPTGEDPMAGVAAAGSGGVGPDAYCAPGTETSGQGLSAFVPSGGERELAGVMPKANRLYSLGYRGTEDYGFTVFGETVRIGTVALEMLVRLDGRNYFVSGYAQAFSGPPIYGETISWLCSPNCGEGSDTASNGLFSDTLAGRLTENGEFSITITISFTGAGPRGPRVYPITRLVGVSCRARIRPSSCYIAAP